MSDRQIGATIPTLGELTRKFCLAVLLAGNEAPRHGC